MKMYPKKIDDNSIQITFENEICIDFCNDEDEWRGQLCWLHDGDSLVESEGDIEDAISRLEMLLVLKRFDPSIVLDQTGDRGGEFFEITIPDEVMMKLIKEA